MPPKPKRPCRAPFCGALVDDKLGFCPAHRKQHHAAIDERRPSSHERGYTGQWRKARAGYLRKHPLCVECAKHGRLAQATDVDHIVPHRGDKALFWDSANWQSLCHPCHSRKTAGEVFR